MHSSNIFQIHKNYCNQWTNELSKNLIICKYFDFNRELPEQAQVHGPSNCQSTVGRVGMWVWSYFASDFLCATLNWLDFFGKELHEFIVI